ncbi:MAG: acyl carrier protein [Acidimicrobiales bacterium]
MTRDELYTWLTERFVEVLEVDPSEITPETDFADLDADSIDLIEVINAAERQFGLEIEEQKLYDLETVGQLVDLLDREIARQR